MEPSTMLLPPRQLSNTFLSAKQLTMSIIHGLMITVGCLAIGYYFIQQEQAQSVIRTVIFITLLFSNIFLTLANRSFRHSVLTTIRYKNYLVPLIIGITLFFVFALLYIPFLRELFGLNILRPEIILICATIGFISTFWLEVYKFMRSKSMRMWEPGTLFTTSSSGISLLIQPSTNRPPRSVQYPPGRCHGNGYKLKNFANGSHGKIIPAKNVKALAMSKYFEGRLRKKERLVRITSKIKISVKRLSINQPVLNSSGAAWKM